MNIWVRVRMFIYMYVHDEGKTIGQSFNVELAMRYGSGFYEVPHPLISCETKFDRM